jgi:hypothetical protein
MVITACNWMYPMVPSRLFRRSKVSPRLPNLLCIGVEKCGTTFLNAAFEPSPSVLTPRKKELFFFNDYFSEGTDWYTSWYDFASKPGARYVADITPSYFRARQNLERIRDLLPDVKIIMVLRHPVYRSFSHYVHRIRHMAPKLNCYGHSYADILARKDVYALLCPHYGKHLQWLLEYFDRNDILLLSYEKDILDPVSAQRKLAAFLNLDDLDFTPMVGRRVNEGSMPRFYHASDAGSVVELNGVRYLPKPGSLLLAHAKGTQEWPAVDPALARANLDAASNWTRALSASEVRRIYQQHFADDLELARREFDVDVDQWQDMADPVNYADAAPEARFLVRQEG